MFVSDMAGCWNTAVRDGHLGRKQNNDKMLKALIHFTMLQGKVNRTAHPANVLKFVPLEEFAELYILFKSG